MSISCITVDDVQKNDNSFSFISTVFDLVVNDEYKANAYNTLCAGIQTNTYVWNSLSAIGETIAPKVQESILNFIDNITNIDVCNIRSLQSLVKAIGSNYIVLKDINTFPLEIQNYIDIFSIRRELLLNSSKLKASLANYLEMSATFSKSQLSNAVSAISDLSSVRVEYMSNLTSIDDKSNLSSKWYSGAGFSELCAATYIDDQHLDTIISAAFKKLILDNLNATYNDFEQTTIYNDISYTILSDEFNIRNLPYYANYVKSIYQDTLQYALEDFDAEVEADNILKGITNYNDYAKTEQSIIDTEFKLRELPFDISQNQTKYMYYKLVKLRDYTNFIEQQYTNIAYTYQNAKIYNIDNQYLELVDVDKKNIFYNDASNKIAINVDIIDNVVKTLVLIVNNVRIMRQHLKSECQRYYMKGTFLLIAHIINQYLIDNIIPAVNKLTGKEPKFNSQMTYSEITEYDDTTQYFNISCTNDLSTNGYINKRYWELDSNKDAIGAIDSTNIFEKLPTVNANDNQFTTEQIDNFYLSTLGNFFEQYSIQSKLSTTQSQHLDSFLKSIFNLQADDTYINENGKYVFNGNELSDYKRLLFDEYIGQGNGNIPYYYYNNKDHPSYQIHPYLISFIEKNDYTFAIQNITNVMIDNVQKQLENSIDTFIDDNGYLINVYRNPLNTNTDYQSRYEFTSNVNNVGAYDPIVAYDGWIYPDGFNVLTSAGIIEYENAIRDNKKHFGNQQFCNYFYGLDMTQAERIAVARQVDCTYQQIANIAKHNSNNEKYVIYRYALDTYGNMYILLKFIATSQNADFATGELWIRKKDSPLPFLAYAFAASNDDISRSSDISQLAYSSSTTNVCFNAVSMHQSYGTSNANKTYTYDIYDFYVATDHRHMLLRCKARTGNETVIKVEITQQYALDIDKTILKFDYAENDSDGYIVSDSDHAIDNYKFIAWYEHNEYYVVAYAKHDVGNNTLKLQAYRNTNQLEFGSSHMTTRSYIEIANAYDGILESTEPTVNICNNDVVIGYISNADLSKMTVDALVAKDISYASIQQYLTDPLQQCLVSRRFQLTEDIDGYISLENSQNYFNGFTDIGMFGLFEGTNDLSNTHICQIDGNMYDPATELNKRGIVKFQLLGPKKEKRIDFKFTLPLRMHEDNIETPWLPTNIYQIKSDDGKHDLSLVNLLAVRYDENTDRTISADMPLYEPFDLKSIAAGRPIDARIGEDVANELQQIFQQDAYVPLCSMMSFPYIMYGKDDDSSITIPTRYEFPGTQSEKWKTDGDNFEINMFTGRQPLSVSWKYNDKNEIQLDFNSKFYNELDISLSNKYNLKHLFLNLDNPGEAGFLNTFTVDKANRVQYDVMYYIKNMSDSHPKFLLSAIPYDGNQNELRILQMDDGSDLYRQTITMAESTHDVNYIVVI